VARLRLAEPQDEVGHGSVSLRYVARAGLIRELSAQTYDAFWKAVREAVLNSIDADASRIDIYLPESPSGSELCIADDGVGMDLRALAEHFVSVGGSARVGDAAKFGRIGIGSLALLQYGSRLVIETKQAGADNYCVAEIQHGEWLKETTRRDLLGDVAAGVARERSYEGDDDDHFTRIRILDPGTAALEAGLDPAARAELTDRLRRVLPLPWPANRLTAELDRDHSVLTECIREHASQQAADVFLHGPWDEGVLLTRRHFGERAGVGEDWTGPLASVYKHLRVERRGQPAREIIVAGYLLNQTHASAVWSGVTARVQNVAVEENTFFDVISDPGFRKYISGEIYLMGEVDRERLINIDRASFNRECEDYLVAQQYLSEVLQRFKVIHVQGPQRQKVAVRAVLKEYAARVEAIERVATLHAGESKGKGAKGLPSSGTRLRCFRRMPIDMALADAQCVVEETSSPVPEVTVGPDGQVVCRLPRVLQQPILEINGKLYGIVFGEADPSDLPVTIRNRPREILFNLAHPAHRGKAPESVSRTLALELAYLGSKHGTTEDLFERILSFLAVT
jgi:hypothetical protein